MFPPSELDVNCLDRLLLDRLFRCLHYSLFNERKLAARSLDGYQCSENSC